MASHFLILPLLATCTLLLSLYPTPIVGPAPMPREPVRDIEGNPIEVGSEYYILPLGGAGFRGGLTTLSKPGQFWCPEYVVQSPRESDLGSPVKFIPRDQTETQIILTSDYQIDSGSSAYCRDNGIWRVNFTSASNQWEVIATGAFDIPRTWFQTLYATKPTTTEPHLYTLLFCPPNEACKNLGGFYDVDGLKFVGAVDAWSDDFMRVGFLKKAQTTTSALHSHATN